MGGEGAMFCLSNVVAAVDYAVERRLVLSFHPGRFNLLAGNFDLSEPRERLTHQIYQIVDSGATFLLPNVSISSLRLSPYDIFPAKSAELESSEAATKRLRISITSACEQVSFSAFLASRTPMK